jgi:hypothetical protein
LATVFDRRDACFDMAIKCGVTKVATESVLEGGGHVGACDQVGDGSSRTWRRGVARGGAWTCGVWLCWR